MKKSIPCCLSHQNSSTYLFRDVLACKQCLICAYFTWQGDFFTGESDIMDRGILAGSNSFKKKNVLMMDLFLTNTQLFFTQDVNRWTGVVWITCGLLWCFYQLFGLILTAPIHCRGSIAEQVMLNFSKSHEETNSSTSCTAWGLSTFSANYFLCELFL